MKKLHMSLRGVRAWLRMSRISMWLFARRAVRSYSQFGEDAVLRGLMKERVADRSYRGFWVDIGAHHPVRYSNTKMFSDLGWRGINVDAMEESIRLFTKVRSRDINIHAGVGETTGEMDYFVFSDPACNSFSRGWMKGTEGAEVPKVRKVMVATLKALLDKHLPSGQHIDFLDVDVEGLDLVVLRSNDWTRYRPDFVLVEIHGPNPWHSPVADYLMSVGYAFAAQCRCTAVFRRNQTVKNGSENE